MDLKNKHLSKTGLIIGLSLLIGLIVGVLDALFGRVLIAITDFRMAHFGYLIPFLAIAGVGFTYFFQKYGQKAQQGMSLVFLVGHQKEAKIPKRMIPFFMIGTWLSHLFGGSVGREGVAVQLGATVANWFERRFKLVQDKTVMIVIGMAAGFGGLFGTPIAATFFAMEVLIVGQLRMDALVPALIAAFTASQTAQLLGLEKFSVNIMANLNLDLFLILKLILLGLIFGLVGKVFAITLKYLKAFTQQKLKNPLVRIGIISIGLSIILTVCHFGRYSGLGTNLISASFSGEEIYQYDWLLKLLLTVVTISAGFLGGEVTPLFAIGSSLGVILAQMLHMPVMLVAALGYASVFGSATSTLLAPIFIGGEVFGFAYLPYFVIVCAIAHFISREISIYPLQQNRY